MRPYNPKRKQPDNTMYTAEWWPGYLAQTAFGSRYLYLGFESTHLCDKIILDKENGDYLEEFGRMINRLYPESPIGDYYIGQYYETGNDFKQALKYYKNGYAKISSADPNGDGYYENVERVLAKVKQGRQRPEEEVIEEEVIEEDGGGGN